MQTKIDQWPENSFHFTNVEEGPLLVTVQASILALVAFCTLVLGLGVNFRIYTMLWKRRSSGGSTAIDKLFLANNIVSLLGHPPLLVRVFQIFFGYNIRSITLKASFWELARTNSWQFNFSGTKKLLDLISELV